jgi:hypothetical protein
MQETFLLGVFKILEDDLVDVRSAARSADKTEHDEPKLEIVHHMLQFH